MIQPSRQNTCYIYTYVHLCPELHSLMKFCLHISLIPSLLTPLWDNSVKILHQVATQHSDQGGLMVFCQRLLYTLQVGPSLGLSSFKVF